LPPAIWSHLKISDTYGCYYKKTVGIRWKMSGKYISDGKCPPFHKIAVTYFLSYFVRITKNYFLFLAIGISNIIQRKKIFPGHKSNANQKHLLKFHLTPVRIGVRIR
jgi:hypothetical protein